jgi:hypothetical protein
MPDSKFPATFSLHIVAKCMEFSEIVSWKDNNADLYSTIFCRWQRYLQDLFVNCLGCHYWVQRHQVRKLKEYIPGPKSGLI